MSSSCGAWSARFGPGRSRRGGSFAHSEGADQRCGASTSYGLTATTRCRASAVRLAGAAVEHAPELPHAACDPLVDLVEHVAALIHRIPDRPRLHRCRVEVAEDHYIAGPSSEAFTDLTALTRVHDHDEIGGADRIGRHGPRPVVGQVDCVALGRVYRLGRRRPVKPYEAGGLHIDAERPEVSIEKCGSHGAAADVAVTDDQKSSRPRSPAQRFECLPPPKRMEDPIGRATYAQQ